MKYFNKMKQGALWACFFILLFQLMRFSSSEKDIESKLNFIMDFGYNFGAVFVVGPLAATLMEIALRDEDKRV